MCKAQRWAKCFLENLPERVHELRNKQKLNQNQIQANDRNSEGWGRAAVSL